MAFSSLIIKEAWERCGGCCECTNNQHDHSGRCKQLLTWFRRGINIDGGWEPQHITPIEEGGTDDRINCKIVCIKCYHGQLQSTLGSEDVTKKEINRDEVFLL